MKYYIVENTGKGFITHEESEISPISHIFGNVYQSANQDWATRVNAVELSEEELEYLRDEQTSNIREGFSQQIDTIQNNNTREKLQSWLETI